MVLFAPSKANELREQGRQRGLKEGREQGREEGREEVLKELQPVIEQLTARVAELEQRLGEAK